MAFLTTSLWLRCGVILSYDPPASLLVAFWAESTFGDKRAEIPPRWFTDSFKMFLRLQRGVIMGQCLVAGKGRTAGVTEVTCFLWNATAISVVCLVVTSDAWSQLLPNMAEHFVPHTRQIEHWTWWLGTRLITRAIYCLLTEWWGTRLTRGDLSPRAWSSRLCRTDMLVHLFGSVAMCEHLRNRHHAPCGVKYQWVWHTQS